MIRIVDAIADFTGRLAAWLFFAVGLFVTYEVVMRYVFNSPTVWVDEVSRIIQIWATYLAGAYVLKHRELIIIDIAFRDPTTFARKIVETFSLLVIILFCAVAVWYGFDQWLAKTLIGDKTDTFLGIPKWMTLSSIWVGFGLLLIQAIVEIIRVWTVGIPQAGADDALHGGH